MNTEPLYKIVNGVRIEMSSEDAESIRKDWASEEAKRELEVATNGYKIERKSAYPSIGDQLDMLWHSMDSGEIPKSLAFYNAIKTVKDKYPKPTK